MLYILENEATEGVGEAAGSINFVLGEGGTEQDDDPLLITWMLSPKLIESVRMCVRDCLSHDGSAILVFILICPFTCGPGALG